jgi:hypothetical protein
MQFSLVSLIPGLLRGLQDCADPTYDTHEKSLVTPTSLKTSERTSRPFPPLPYQTLTNSPSVLTYMGLPLQIFGKGAFFGPYTPLQQLDLLADYGTKSYLVGSTNSLLLQQRDRYSDILINLDDHTLNITSPSLRSALSLSPADRRWIDFLTQTVNDTWDDSNPSSPRSHTYVGSESFIRLQFEEYLLALLSSAKYQTHLSTNPPTPPSDPQRTSRDPSPTPSNPITTTSPHAEPPTDPTPDFSPDFLTSWRLTPNYQTFTRLTPPSIYDIVVPRHPCAGGLTIDDVQRRLAQQVAELHLDERVRESREVLNKHLVTGQKRVTIAFNSLWADIEAMREAQRKKRAESSTSEKENAEPTLSPTNSYDPSGTESAISSEPLSPTTSTAGGFTTWTSAARARAPELQASASATAQAASQKASAYLSSWSSWASEKKKDWDAKRQANATTTEVEATTGGGRGGTAVGGLGVTPETDRRKRDSGLIGRWSGSLGPSEEKEWKSTEEKENEERGQTADIARE